MTEHKWLVWVVYVILCAALSYAGYVHGRNTATLYTTPTYMKPVISPDGIVDIRDMEMGKALLVRFNSFASRSAAKWEEKHGKLTGEQIATYVWLIENVVAHPCPLEGRFVEALTDAALETSLRMGLATGKR